MRSVEATALVGTGRRAPGPVPPIGIAPVDDGDSQTQLLDQAAVLQRAQVSAHGGRSETQCGGELAGAVRPRTQQVDRAPSHRVGERAENAVDGRAQSSSRVLVVKPPSASHSSAVFAATVTPKVQIWPSGSLAR